MKKTIIKDILHGLRGSFETVNVPHDADKYKSDGNDIYNEFEAKLSPEAIELFDKIIDIHGDEMAEEVEAYFVEGFKLGLRIGIECMDD
jgi:hypothetical protein